MDQNWDYLIILDACRYDIFSEVVDIDGELTPVISQGSHSEEFCTANFAGNRLYDTVYVTANGYGARIGKNTFHDLIFTDKMDSVPDNNILHSTKEGLVPSTVHNADLKSHDKYPNKRMIIHFMQPHSPFLGSKAGGSENVLKTMG